MASRRHNTVKLLLYLAADLEGRGYWSAGVLRQLAQQVATMPDADADEPGRCGCGQVIVQPRTGRPRKFCFACSPPRKTPGKRHSVSESSVDREQGAA